MKISPKNEKIEKYLNELSDEYKELLFKALISQSDSMENLSVSDLLRLDAEIKRPLMEDYKRLQRRRNRLLSVGLAYTFSGFFLYILFQLTYSDRIWDVHQIFKLISLMIAMIGLFAIVMALISPIMSKSSKRIINSKKDTKPLLEYELFTKWRELEGKVNDISGNNNVKAYSSIIEYLSKNNLINDDEYQMLKEFLKMRNNIVHNANNEYSETELNDMINKVNGIILRINKIL